MAPGAPLAVPPERRLHSAAMQVLLLAALAWVSVSVLVVSLGAAAARGDRQPAPRRRRRPAPPSGPADHAARIARIDHAARQRRTTI
jgi:hypothetical protein